MVLTHMLKYVNNTYEMMVEILDMMDNSSLYPHLSNLLE